MNTQQTPPILNRRLGRRLKALREQAGMTLEQAAARLEKTRSALSRIETGMTKVDIHLLRSMLDLYDRYEEDLFDQVRQALKPRWFRAYGTRNMGYVDAETEAVTVHEFSGLNIPGLLQTEAYMRQILRTSHLQRTDAELESQVALRMMRQRRLTSEDDPLQLVAVVDEAALRRKVGGPEVMREQLRHLIDLAALPTVTPQVSALRGGSHSAMEGAFILLTFPELEDPDLLYVSYVTGALHIEKDDEVRAARLIFDQLRSKALNPADSVALIEQLADELYGP